MPLACLKKTYFLLGFLKLIKVLHELFNVIGVPRTESKKGVEGRGGGVIRNFEIKFEF